jgi:glycosyltransferase involved in cell wall biosynthesis
MTKPLVCAIMLTKDRTEMLRRAVQSFRAQTYPNKWLIVLDSGGNAGVERLTLGSVEIYTHLEPASIGKLRNVAVELARAADIIVHVDDDDWSHPNRIAEQVAHLQASGADVVGYNELLFWREMFWDGAAPELPRGIGSAWLYHNRNARAETSFCYWRKTWEQKPFPDGPKLGPRGYSGGEGYSWCQGLKVEMVSGITKDKWSNLDNDPRLIASIHGGNTMSYDIEGMIARGSDNWKRVPAWDKYCAERMRL